jgi:hypothetical protein
MTERITSLIPLERVMMWRRMRLTFSVWSLLPREGKEISINLGVTPRASSLELIKMMELISSIK